MLFAKTHHIKTLYIMAKTVKYNFLKIMLLDQL